MSDELLIEELLDPFTTRAEAETLTATCPLASGRSAPDLQRRESSRYPNSTSKQHTTAAPNPRAKTK